MRAIFALILTIIIIIIVIVIIVEIKKAIKRAKRSSGYVQPKSMFKELIDPNMDKIFQACLKNQDNLTFDSIKKDLADTPNLPITQIVEKAKKLIENGSFSYDTLRATLL